MVRGIQCSVHPEVGLICIILFGHVGIFAFFYCISPHSAAEDVLKDASATFTHDELMPNTGVPKQTSKLFFQEYIPPLSRQILSFLQIPALSEETTALRKEPEGLKNLVREASAHPEPKRWPDQFHAQIFQNRSDHLALVDLWYDWPGGRNLNLIHSQLGSSLWDVEWTNGTR